MRYLAVLGFTVALSVSLGLLGHLRDPMTGVFAVFLAVPGGLVLSPILMWAIRGRRWGWQMAFVSVASASVATFAGLVLNPHSLLPPLVGWGTMVLAAVGWRLKEGVRGGPYAGLNVCQACGYSCAGLPESAPCPECGKS